MRFPRNVRIFRGQLDMAPLAGVFFLLIAFLLLNTSLVFIPGLQLDLPVKVTLPAVTGPELPGTENPRLVVVVDLRGQLYFDQRVVQEEELRIQLAQAVKRTPHLTLVVQFDKDARVETLVQLGKMASDLGIRKVDVAARPPPFPEKAQAAPVP